MKPSRRKFIRQGGMAVASTALLGQLPLTMISGRSAVNPATGSVVPRSFGFQVWPVQLQLREDFGGILRKISEMGYSEVEMCSPLGYGWSALNEMPGPDMRQVIEEAGLKSTSSHFTMGELRDNLENRIEWANDLGMEQMILSTFWLPDGSTIDDYRRSANELNGIAEITKAAGIQMGFHNHHMEFEIIGDTLIYDALMEEFDPELVKMQFQVAVISIGYKAADYFRKYPGRFISAHLADWSPETEGSVNLGEGVVDWPDLFEAAVTGGVKNFYVEMTPDALAPGAEYLMSL